MPEVILPAKIVVGYRVDMDYLRDFLAREDHDSEMTNGRSAVFLEG
jgi:hypothetical protein